MTTLTTVAGFMGLYFAAYMPPFSYFGLFTAIGVLIAWIYSLLFLPAAMAIVKPRVSARFVRAWKQQKPDVFARLVGRMGRYTQRHARATVLVAALLAAIGIYSASQLRVDEDRIETFDSGERIYLADKVINRYLDGTNNLDIVIETPQAEDLFEPENLAKMEALQEYAETLPHVMGSTSIVDYLKQMNRSLNEGRADAYRLPASKELAAQYFLLYSASSEPTDFEEEVDYDYQMANIRVTLNSGSYVDTKVVVEALQDYLYSYFNSPSIKATLSGRVNVSYHWIRDLGASHFAGLGIALLLVWMVSSLLFRSSVAGLYSLIPVAGAVLLVYATMVALDIHLGIGTSMFASVAIGLGVDFAIHTIERLRVLYREHRGNLSRAMDELYLTTGRALLFNFMAIAGGFGVLISSKVVPLNNFGLIVVLSVTTSFFASMTLLPALVKVFRPGFMEPAAQARQGGFRRAVSTMA
ncbi:MAG: RND family transporter, partial [Lysobacterales bacterium]